MLPLLLLVPLIGKCDRDQNIPAGELSQQLISSRRARDAVIHQGVTKALPTSAGSTVAAD
jgi:hypothetical protein